MRPTERCEMLLASPRLTASRASSFWLQWVIGRSQADGGSQASAMMAQTCSAVKRAGARRIGQTVGRLARSSPPTLPPEAHRPGLDPQFAGRRAHAGAAAAQQDAEQQRCSGPQGPLLRRAMGAHQAL